MQTNTITDRQAEIGRLALTGIGTVEIAGQTGLSCGRVSNVKRQLVEAWPGMGVAFDVARRFQKLTA